MENCPKCGEKLNIDEKSSGKCFSCGGKFERLNKEKDKVIEEFNYDNMSNGYINEEFNYDSMLNGNIIAGIIKIFVVIGFIIATIGNLCILTQYGYGFGDFLVKEFIIAISCLILLGLSEIISLLNSINNKIKNSQ